jgi:acetyl esterase/lipase
MSPIPQQPPLPDIVFATSVASSDTSSSIVLDPPRGEQIRIGRIRVDAHDDIVYATRGTGVGQRLELALDLLVPQTEDAKPLVVYLSGGGFVISPKEGAAERRRYVAEAGYAVASVRYRTVMDGATYADGVADVKSAILFLRARAAHYGIDARRVAVWGESAGGYLAATTGATNGIARFEAADNPGQSSSVQAVVDLFGPSDLLNIAADFDAAARRAHAAPGIPASAYVFGPGAGGRALADDPAAVALADPATYVRPGTPPFLLMHGSLDTMVSPSQTLLLHEALRAQGVESTRYVLTGAGHGDLGFLGDMESGLPWTTRETMDLITRFLSRALKPDATH